MPVDIGPLRADLAAESADLVALLEGIPLDQWLLPTPSVGWTISDQVSHLAYFDETTSQSLVDPEGFRAAAAELTRAGDDFPDRVAAGHRHLGATELLDWFRRGREALLHDYACVGPATRLPWYGPDMGVASSITARLMETWAHGQDIADTVRFRRAPTDRLRHVADIGIRALPYSFHVHHQAVPAAPIHVELTGPHGDTWHWGEPGAPDRVTGTALDFCLVVTQRRHVDDTALAVRGATATAWIGVAQAFAGPAGPGRERGFR
jgi:uncharacterized protein (TIGR03084 family)